MKRVLAIILGGGAGTRLYPLTKMRAKPAVPLAGKYRLIDIPVSNCINSEINKILHTPVTHLRAPQPRQQRHLAMTVLRELFELSDSDSPL
jgi:ADP-glucose pyrophosphorylase